VHRHRRLCLYIDVIQPRSVTALWLMFWNKTALPRKNLSGGTLIITDLYYISRESAAAACLHYCTDPDVICGSGRRSPSCALYADLQSMHGLHCYGNTTNAWQSPAVIRQAHRTPHSLRTHARKHAPAIKSTRLLHARRYLQISK